MVWRYARGNGSCSLFVCMPRMLQYVAVIGLVVMADAGL